MSITKVFEGKTEYVQILDKDGKVDKKLEPKISADVLMSMYRHMVLLRAWDKKCLALQRTGRMYTYAPAEGQEAIVVGSGLALGAQDWIFPTYRESYLYYIRGASLDSINLAWMGYEDGLKVDPKLHAFPVAIPIATQYAHATGAGYALKLKKIDGAAVAYGGDGSTSEGDFHDALNFAGVLESPCVFIVSNNQWAISTPRKWQTKSDTIAQKALAYGLKGIQADGNDILAVHSLVREALENARAGKGSTLLEFITYRMGPHTTADDPKKYRGEEEVTYWRERDPIKRFQKYLADKGIWNETFEKEVTESAVKIVEESVEKAEAFKADRTEIFKHALGFMTKDLEEQMKECFEGQ